MKGITMDTGGISIKGGAGSELAMLHRYKYVD